ncbi:protein GrpE [Sesamum angolense]|uniref:GrpE protein homolog n=1 Tax=Sesamum angolense TaxID=2727404 RepID=A0AAE1W625_9LAMI|nr:protein GrpE [Sesamum angolense]
MRATMNTYVHLNDFCVKKWNFIREGEGGDKTKFLTNDSDEFQAPEGAADRRLPARLKLIMQAYKEAVLDGDRKAIYELEDILFMMEKEKNELAQKVAAMSAEISSGKEKLVRLQADFDNYRRRSEKERLRVRSDAQGEVIESLLPMVDSFERAKQQIKLETEMEKKIDTSYQGIYKQFVEIMRSLHVAAVPTVGKPFDPKMHEAIAREESNEFKEGIVIQEFRRGFYLGDRLLRPAMVKVSSGPGKKKPASPPDQSREEPASVAGVDNR